MKTTRLQRWSRLKKILRGQLITAINANNLVRAKTVLNRLNAVCRDNRNRNLLNGMPGDPWLDVTLEKAIKDVKEKGLK